tara:strand:- start:2036 stop:3760 length:1725 start_codon:yes stop_codon:yes gene_type:complete
MYINEDYIAKWVEKQGGLLLTRSIKNIDTFDISQQYNPFYVCITGYQQILDIFFNKLMKLCKEKFILIIIETDVVKMKKEWLEDDRLIHCYTWNKPYEHHKMSCIPIGLNFNGQYKSMLEFLQLKNKNEKNENENENENEKNVKNKNEKNKKKEKKLLCFNCSLYTSEERVKLKGIIETRFSKFCDQLQPIPFKKMYYIPSFIEGKIRIRETDKRCYEEWGNYKYILSPQGAGLDCHRTWEAIMIGIIPIVKSSSIDEIYNELPVLVIKDWNELSVKLLNNKLEEINKCRGEKMYNFERLYIKYWVNKMEKTMRKYIKPSYLNNKKIHFITYGDDKFKQSKKRIMQEAMEFEEFTSIQSYEPDDLPIKFKEKHEDILNRSRGGGYWIWRPKIILDRVENMEWGDYLVYLDAGCTINKQGKKRFYEYIEQLEKSEYGIVSFQMNKYDDKSITQKEKWWTTKEIFNFFDEKSNSEIGESGQYLGGVLIMKKNEHLMEYLDRFDEIIEENPLLCTDEYNNNGKQENYFKDNRHEQSVTSILRKKMGSVVIKRDESWCPPFGRGESLKYPFWATRLRK